MGSDIVFSPLGNSIEAAEITDGTITNVKLATPAYVASGSYTGNGGSQSITGLGFQPVGVIFYSSDGYHYFSNDALSGSCFYINPTVSGVQATAVAMTADGFDLTAQSNKSPNINTTTYRWVAWK